MGALVGTFVISETGFVVLGDPTAGTSVLGLEAGDAAGWSVGTKSTVGASILGLEGGGEGGSSVGAEDGKAEGSEVRRLRKAVGASKLGEPLGAELGAALCETLGCEWGAKLGELLGLEDGNTAVSLVGAKVGKQKESAKFWRHRLVWVKALLVIRWALSSQHCAVIITCKSFVHLGHDTYYCNSRHRSCSYL